MAGALQRKDFWVAMSSLFSGADSLIASRINDTPLSLDPFDHCVVDNILPKEMFDAIHARWPSADCMMSLPETGRITSTTGKYRDRYVMLLEDRFFEKQTPDNEEFWVSVAQTLMSSAVLLACYKKFEAVLKPRVDHLGQDLTLNPEMLVVSDRSNYFIGPHTDSKARLISLLLYLSPDPQYLSYGTGLYVPKDPELPVDDLKHHSVEDFNLHTRVDFKPNRLVMFPRSDQSYHGVEPVPVEDCDRRLLIINVRAPQGAR